MNEDFPVPFLGGRLFIEGRMYHRFAHVGWGNTDTKFFMYENGYKTAADHLIDSAIKAKDISQLDSWVYPIVFLL